MEENEKGDLGDLFCSSVFLNIFFLCILKLNQIEKEPFSFIVPVYFFTVATGMAAISFIKRYFK